ncbi:multicopper oxidase domain-containing protein [Intrasporangium sp. YIM S08009]|uniref:multicopper oxidase domain-containing protein n=1 Tax=Intrasporangium zincisolvens TaxID=3080018 RepID=UPI002B05FB3A|nr:multicopper oxidase domain-containing protein [Intrasporangium sp. YIM S08009]
MDTLHPTEPGVPTPDAVATLATGPTDAPGAAAEAGHGVSRRRFLGLAGGAALVAGVGTWGGRVLAPEQVASAADAPANLYLAGTDGWIHLPPTPAIPPYHPDNLAPAGLTTYVFGFRNVTGMTTTQRLAQKNKAQHSAPLFWVDQYDPNAHNEFRVQLTNLGLALRPDLFDAHTLHWHGFRNVIPFFDGEPTGSVSVPAGREFTYVYRPRDPGTYMFHCHVEDVEHVHMGMTGLVFVRPIQDGQSKTYQGRTYTKFLYNDGDGSTGHDREFAMFLSEVWAEAHWADAHIQLPEWSDYRADFALLNGRVYPDTLEPNGPSVNAFHTESGVTFDPSGDLIAPAGRPDLQYQPNSSLVRCNSGERVALRFANLGFRESAMTTSGIRMRVVGRDATPMRGRDGTDTSYETETLNIGPGESYDVVFTAPPKTGSGAYDTYYLYNRAFNRSNNLAPGGFGGQATEIRVYASGVGPQSYPNDWGN